MVVVTRCTAPGTPRPGYGSTCPQAGLEKPSRTDGLDHHHLWLLPEEHDMAPHQGHQNGASALVSRALVVPQQPHPSAASLHAAVSPALAVQVL
jgi:hypothetical protein